MTDHVALREELWKKKCSLHGRSGLNSAASPKTVLAGRDLLALYAAKGTKVIEWVIDDWAADSSICSCFSKIPTQLWYFNPANL